MQLAKIKSLYHKKYIIMVAYIIFDFILKSIAFTLCLNIFNIMIVPLDILN